MKKMLFIYNARSGKTLVKRYLADIIDIFIKSGYHVEAYQTQKIEDAKIQVETRGDEFDTIVCCGGDGTLNETISGLMELPDKPILGYIPAGSTNDFATTLGLPKNMLQAAKVAASGKNLDIDIGCFNEKKFVYVAGFGAFTDVSYQTPQEMKNILGHQAYIVEAIKKLPSLREYKMKCEFDDCVLEGNYLYGMVSNSSSVGGMKGITGKDISLCDGVFEVTLVRPTKNIIEFQAMIADLLNGTNNSDHVLRFKTSKITFTSEENVAWVLDGECGGEVTKAVIANDKGAVTIKTKK